jgi:hypothetical protein
LTPLPRAICAYTRLTGDTPISSRATCRFNGGGHHFQVSVGLTLAISLRTPRLVNPFAGRGLFNNRQEVGAIAGRHIYSTAFDCFVRLPAMSYQSD